MPELLPDSEEALQIVALLARSDAYWTATAISQQLGIAEDLVEAKLEALAAAHVVVRGKETVAYRFARWRESRSDFFMAEKSDEVTLPQAKRRDREGIDPKSQPGEFADDLRVNRFTPPPDPPATGEKEDE